MKRLVWFAVVLGLVAAAFMLGTRFATREAAFAASADGTRAAWADDRRCWSGPCQTLWIGANRGNATKVATLEGPSHCDEIVWTRDGTRVAFLVDGAQLRFYDPVEFRARWTDHARAAADRSEPIDRAGRDVLRERPGDHVRRVPSRPVGVSCGTRRGAAVNAIRSASDSSRVSSRCSCIATRW